MDVARYARVKELFEAALPLGATERSALLARECRDDDALEREVAELLRHHEKAPDFLTGHAGSDAAPAERPMPKLRVHGFILERELGRGGMGIVYLAEQERPRRKVALKFLRLDSLGPGDVMRFEREAEILGQLNHAGIAHVYGVGLAESEQGELPWIAMEYVRGVPLRDYVSAHALGLRGLVELFAELCDAVEHAHQKGIVHRDLKPSNVLVDERGAVRVLDFGVARLLADGAAAGTNLTRTGQMVGTLAYASPEQAAGRIDAVNARSDVYALGVMLHELLTDELPYAIDESKVLEAIQTICDEDPRRLRRLRRDAPRDLETILLKALEKEPVRRYTSAGELATDLRRFLADRPVAARAPTALYRVRKFVRRNRALTVSTTAVILALLVTVGVLFVSQRRDRRHLEHTRSMLDLMAKMIFRLVPEVGFGADHRGELETLDEALATELVLTPGDRALRGYRARSLYELGALDQVNGDLAAASARFEGARALREGLVTEDSVDLESRTHLSQIYARLGEVARLSRDSAGELAWFQRAFELDQELVREHPGDGELLEDLGWSLERMTDLAVRRQDWTEADRYARWRLADATRLVDGDPSNWKYLNNAAMAHVLAGTVAAVQAPREVEGHHRELLRLARRLYEIQPRRADFLSLWAMANLGLAKYLLEASRYQEALPHAEAASSLCLQLLASDPRSFRNAHQLQFAITTLCAVQQELGLRQQAEAILERAQVAANIAGENTPIALYLLATVSSGIPPEWQLAPEAVREIEERTLQHFQALFLSPGVSVEMTESAVRWFRAGWAHLSPELCTRLLAIDERVARKMATLLEVDPQVLPGLAAGELSMGR